MPTWTKCLLLHLRKIPLSLHADELSLLWHCPWLSATGHFEHVPHIAFGGVTIICLQSWHLALDFSLCEGRVPNLFVFSYLNPCYLTHSRLPINTCQRYERHNAYGSPLKTTKALRKSKRLWDYIHYCWFREKDLECTTLTWKIRWSDYH